jgi:hypothetical protein
VRITREIIETTRRLADELANTPGLRIVGVPEVSIQYTFLQYVRAPPPSRNSIIFAKFKNALRAGLIQYLKMSRVFVVRLFTSPGNFCMRLRLLSYYLASQLFFVSDHLAWVFFF